MPHLSRPIDDDLSSGNDGRVYKFNRKSIRERPGCRPVIQTLPTPVFAQIPPPKKHVHLNKYECQNMSRSTPPSPPPLPPTHKTTQHLPAFVTIIDNVSHRQRCSKTQRQKASLSCRLPSCNGQGISEAAAAAAAGVSGAAWAATVAVATSPELAEEISASWWR